MNNLQIALANGSVTNTDKLRHYFDTVFAAEDSGEEFAVNLEHIWRVGHSRKDNAVRALTTTFTQGIDYQVFLINEARVTGGRPTEQYHLTTSCAEFFAVRSNREVFEVYINCRKAIRALARPVAPTPLPNDFASALRLLADNVEANAQLQAQLLLNAPKVAFTDAVALSSNPIPIGAVAKYLKLPGVGRNKLFRMMREDKILRPNNEPYQSQVDNGHFSVELQLFTTGEKGPRTAGTTRCTGKGLIYLALKYKQPA